MPKINSLVTIHALHTWHMTMVQTLTAFCTYTSWDVIHRFIHSDCSHQPHNVGMPELSHDGCFLEECGLTLVSGAFLQYPDSNLLWAIRGLPGSFKHLTKFTRTKGSFSSWIARKVNQYQGGMYLQSNGLMSWCTMSHILTSKLHVVFQYTSHVPTGHRCPPHPQQGL